MNCPTLNFLLNHQNKTMAFLVSSVIQDDYPGAMVAVIATFSLAVCRLNNFTSALHSTPIISPPLGLWFNFYFLRTTCR